MDVKSQLKVLQHELYTKAYEDAHALIAGDQHSIIEYSDRFEADLPEHFVFSSLRRLLKSVAQARWILFGDFHTLKQSQRGFLGIMKSYIKAYPSRRIIVGLEAFKSQHQDLLEGYLADRISERSFLQQSGYFEYWGFPWPHFREVLEFCRLHEIEVVALNTSGAGKDALLERDRFAADILLQTHLENEGAQIFTLVGEYHLADQHLPRQLYRLMRKQGCQARVLRVLGNIDQYFFKMEKQFVSTATQYLQLRRDMYCVMNCPPWMKWQSYTLFEETKALDEPESAAQPNSVPVQLLDEENFYTEHTFDIDENFHNFLKNLNDFTGLELTKRQLSDFHIFLVEQVDLLQYLSTHHPDWTEGAVKSMAQRVVRDGVFVDETTRTVMLSRISVNSLAEASGNMLHAQRVGSGVLLDDSVLGFYQRVVKSSLGMFSSLVFNPRRKSLDIRFFRALSERLKARTLRAGLVKKRASTRALIEFYDWALTRQKSGKGLAVQPKVRVARIDAEHDFEVSRRMGQMLGRALYRKLSQNRVSIGQVRKLFTHPSGDMQQVGKTLAWLLKHL